VGFSSQDFLLQIHHCAIRQLAGRIWIIGLSTAQRIARAFPCRAVGYILTESRIKMIEPDQFLYARGSLS